MATQKQIAEAEAKAKALAEQGETIPEAVTKLEAPDAELPDSVTVLNLYGYLNEETGVPKFWQENQVVTDPAEIADLIARQVPVKE